MASSIDVKEKETCFRKHTSPCGSRTFSLTTHKFVVKYSQAVTSIKLQLGVLQPEPVSSDPQWSSAECQSQCFDEINQCSRYFSVEREVVLFFFGWNPLDEIVRVWNNLPRRRRTACRSRTAERKSDAPRTLSCEWVVAGSRARVLPPASLQILARFKRSDGAISLIRCWFVPTACERRSIPR